MTDAESGTEISQNKVRQVVCPYCGVNPTGQCRDVDKDGRATEPRDPHPERVELAAEYWDVDRYGKGAVTGQWYRVSEWEDVGGGKMIAKSKEPVDEDEVPEIWRGAMEWTLEGGEA